VYIQHDVVRYDSLTLFALFGQTGKDIGAIFKEPTVTPTEVCMLCCLGFDYFTRIYCLNGRVLMLVVFYDFLENPSVVFWIVS